MVFFDQISTPIKMTTEMIIFFLQTLVVSGERVTLFKVPGPLANRETMAGQLTEEILPHGVTTLVARGKRVTLFKIVPTGEQWRGNYR